MSRRSQQSRHKLRRKKGIPARVRVLPDERLIADIERFLDRADAVIDFLEMRLPHVGRRREVSVHAALMVLMLLLRMKGRLWVTDFDDLVIDASHETLERLGLVRQNGKYVTSKQLWLLFRRIGESLDPTGGSQRRGRALSDNEKNERRTALQWFADRMLDASIPTWMTHDGGDYACDATMKWAWSRPGRLNQHRAPGNKRAATTMEELFADDQTLEDAGFDLTDETVTDVLAAAQSKHDPDARFLGREGDKACFGYAKHSVVRTGDVGPILTERMRITPATANPAHSMMPLLAGLRADRLADPVIGRRIEKGLANPIGIVTADCGYSQAVDEDWYLPLKSMGATPISRLHKANQAGVHRRHAKVTFCNGTPVCECITEYYASIRYPKVGAAEVEHTKFQKDCADLHQRFGYRTNGKLRTDGSRQFLAPHYDSDREGGPGGCEYCVTGEGDAVNDELGNPRPRCCTKRSYVFNAKELAQYQEPQYGTAKWYASWRPRNRVEASYSLVKNNGPVRWGDQDSHRYRGLAFETVIAVFVDVVTNLEQMELWEIEESVKPGGGRPRNPGLEAFLPEPIATSASYGHSTGPP